MLVLKNVIFNFKNKKLNNFINQKVVVLCLNSCICYFSFLSVFYDVITFFGALLIVFECV